jgi:Domain of unknown function (DUF4139)
MTKSRWNASCVVEHEQGGDRGTRTIDVAYEITVENHRPSKSRVSVHDHVPVSTDGDIKVRLRETSPNQAEQIDLGELTWELSLEAGRHIDPLQVHRPACR